ncbi:hypothetical protein D3C86_1546320 [compost metagenome]
MGQVVAGAGLESRRTLSRGSQAAAGPRKARLRHRRLRLHHLQRHVRRARSGDPEGDRRPRPVRHGSAVRQPQLRRPHPPVRQAGVPGLAAAGGGLRHRRHDPLRHRTRRAGQGRRRQAGLPEGHLAERRGNRRNRRQEREAGAVPQGVRADVRHLGGPGRGREPALRLARPEHLHPPSAVLGRRAGRRAYAAGHAAAGSAR